MWSSACFYTFLNFSIISIIQFLSAKNGFASWAINRVHNTMSRNITMLLCQTLKWMTRNDGPLLQPSTFSKQKHGVTQAITIYFLPFPRVSITKGESLNLSAIGRRELSMRALKLDELMGRSSKKDCFLKTCWNRSGYRSILFPQFWMSYTCKYWNNRLYAVGTI